MAGMAEVADGEWVRTESGSYRLILDPEAESLAEAAREAEARANNERLESQLDLWREVGSLSDLAAERVRLAEALTQLALQPEIGQDFNLAQERLARVDRLIEEPDARLVANVLSRQGGAVNRLLRDEVVIQVLDRGESAPSGEAVARFRDWAETEDRFDRIAVGIARQGNRLSAAIAVLTLGNQSRVFPVELGLSLDDPLPDLEIQDHNRKWVEGSTASLPAEPWGSGNYRDGCEFFEALADEQGLLVVAAAYNSPLLPPRSGDSVEAAVESFLRQNYGYARVTENGLLYRPDRYWWLASTADVFAGVSPDEPPTLREWAEIATKVGPDEQDRLMQGLYRVEFATDPLLEALPALKFLGSLSDPQWEQALAPNPMPFTELRAQQRELYRRALMAGLSTRASSGEMLWRLAASNIPGEDLDFYLDKARRPYAQGSGDAVEIAEHRTLGNPEPGAEEFDLWLVQAMFGPNYEQSVTYRFVVREIE
jgi:hypothetical protein